MPKSYTKDGAAVVTFATEQKNASTDQLVTLESSIDQILDGDAFYVERVDADLDTDGTIKVLLVTPNTTKHAHVLIGFTITKGSTFTFYEGTVTTDDGTALVEHNKNRNSTKSATLVATHTPTITGNGTLLQTKYAGTNGKYGNPGTARGENEWILKANTKYLIVLTAHEDDEKARVFMNWHEHIDIA